MKRNYKFLTFVLLIILGLSSGKLISQEKLYVYFDDIGVVVNHENIPWTYEGKPAADHIYWSPLLTHNNFFTSNLLKTGYKNFFNSGKKLTDYEVAIFYMGDQPLQYDGGSGHRVVTEIKNMLDEGKRVILIGNQLLTLAFNEGSPMRDSEVQKFFADYVGVDENAYYGAIETTSGNLYKPYGIKAIQGDPVAGGYKKACNKCQSENNVPALCPWRFRTFIEAIDRLKMDEDVVMMEYYTPIHDATELNTAPLTDIAVGVHLQRPGINPVQDSKIVFWTTGFEVAAASFYMPNWMEEMWDALYWCSFDLPKPGPHLEFNVNPLDFGTVPLDDSLQLEVKITNIGRDPLNIYDFYVDSPVSSGFEVMTDDLEHTLKPGEFIYIPIMFRPLDETTYDEMLWVESNSVTGNSLHIDLIGYGGKKPEPGPRLAVAETLLDFGTIKPFEIDTMYIKVYNSGIDLLIIQEKFFWPNEKQPPFMYAKPETWPISLQPASSDQDTHIVPIKFAPAGMSGTFNDRLGIIPYNAVNYKEDTLWITLKGTAREGNSDAAISLSMTELEIDSVELGQKGYSEFTIVNTGTVWLDITELKMLDDYDGVFKLLDKNNKEFQDQLPWALFTAGPQKERKVKLEFNPTEEKVYNGKILIKIADNETGNPLSEWDSEISVTAYGKDTLSGINVRDARDPEAKINLSVNPNPVSGNARLYYNVNTFESSHLEIFIVDILGNRTQEILSSQTDKGNYSIELNTQNLSDGMYFIIAKIGGDFVKLPIALMK